MPAPGHVLRTTLGVVAFEGGLGAVALLIGWFVGYPLAPGFAASNAPNAAFAFGGYGLLAALPLLFCLFSLERVPWPPLRRLEARVRVLIVRLFEGAPISQLLLISVAAGFGEELLFRGLIQAGLADWLGGDWGSWIALVVASLAFGVCHWLDSTYAALATLAGAYFGLLLIVTDSLWAPIVAHATYDFLALLYLLRANDLLRWNV